MIKVQFYGVLRELAGASDLSCPLDEPAPVSEILQRLQARLPALAEHLPRLACAVDDRIVPRSHVVEPGATLALLPPVSGG